MTLAIDNTARALRRGWHPVARGDDVGPDPTAVTLLGDRWLVVRRHGALDAISARVPAAARLPFTVATDSPTVAPAGLVERYGLIWLAPLEPITDLIEVPEWQAPGFTAVAIDPDLWNAGAAQMADNFLDVAHFPYAHRHSFGDPDDREVHDYQVTRIGWGLQAIHHHRARPSGDWAGAEAVERIQIFTYRAPFAIHLRIEYPLSGVVRALLFATQPVDAAHSRLFVVELRNDIEAGGSTVEAARAMAEQVLREDRALLEQFDTKAVPLDLRAEVHTRADRITVEFRRVLRDLVAGD